VTPAADSAVEALFAAALAARQKAYAPYSNFLVGAAFRDEQGRIHAGCNVENAAFPQGACAETGAMTAMVLAGGTRITEALVLGWPRSADGAGGPLCTPCGGCRQRLREFASPDLRVHIADRAGLRATFSLAQLLPESFGPEHL
jgi:cytidine deaminase